jgi:hypothetical protein
MRTSVILLTRLAQRGGTPFDLKTQCCEGGKVVKKVPLYVINRNGDGSSGHIDLLFDDGWMIGFYGRKNTGCKYMFMDGYLTSTPTEWWDTRHGRPQYVSGEEPVYVPGGGEFGRPFEAPAMKSLICEIMVCPAAAAKMKEKAKEIDREPETFHIFGRNCSTVATDILAAGGVYNATMGADFDTPDNMQRGLLYSSERCVVECYTGYTLMDKATGHTRIVGRGPTPAGWETPGPYVPPDLSHLKGLYH